MQKKKTCLGNASNKDQTFNVNLMQHFLNASLHILDLPYLTYLILLISAHQAHPWPELGMSNNPKHAVFGSAGKGLRNTEQKAIPVAMA